MQQQQLVLVLPTLEQLYSEVYFLSSIKSSLLVNKNCKVSIKIEGDTITAHYPFSTAEKTLLVNFLQQLIFTKIDAILAIEKTMF